MKHIVSVLVLAVALPSCSSTTRYASGKRAPETDEPPRSSAVEGFASYYAHEFHGRKTANGEIYDMYAMTAAHRTLPFGTRIRVRNTDNGRSVVVRINDRGPFKDDRIIDVSLAAAKELQMIGPGTVWVRLEILGD